MNNEEAKKNINTYILSEHENIPKQLIEALEIYSDDNEKQIQKKPKLKEDKMLVCANCVNNILLLWTKE